MPRVYSDDICTFEPVTSADQVNVGDIVFCQVFPSHYFYGHIVKEKWWEEDKLWFTICNLKTFEDGYGRINGWTDLAHVYGKLIQVSV